MMAISERKSRGEKGSEVKPFMTKARESELFMPSGYHVKGGPRFLSKVGLGSGLLCNFILPTIYFLFHYYH